MNIPPGIKSINEKVKNVAIIGSGGRENSLAWAIQRNNSVKSIFIIPGNGGSKEINKCENLDINISDIKSLVNKFDELKIDLIVIGPEIPLANGLGDKLREYGYLVFGPGKDGAKLESSKSWAKKFMQKAKIPTAAFWTIETLEKAKEVIYSSSKQLVVKADGLASGKGVILPESKEETYEITKEILNGKFGDSGKTVVLEERIEGPEVSVFAICDGERYVLLPTAQDHKRLQEKDLGLNTGGMGAYAPTPLISDNAMLEIQNNIINPTVKELRERGIDYRGVLYFGLMITDSGPKVIEYNCRFGDPECQTIMPLMDNDFVNLLSKCSMGKLNGNETINFKDKVSGCVIATSGGYPLDYEIDFPIKISTTEDENFQIFHSGTKINDSKQLVTNGGRVLSIVCQGDDFDLVFQNAYNHLKEINFEGMFYRRDIGHQVRNSWEEDSRNNGK